MLPTLTFFVQKQTNKKKKEKKNSTFSKKKGSEIRQFWNSDTQFHECRLETLKMSRRRKEEVN